MQKFFKTVAKIFLFTILCFNFAYAENITGSGNEVAEDTDEQQNINANDTEVTVKNSATLERANSSIKTNTHLRATIVVESGATVSTSTALMLFKLLMLGKDYQLRTLEQLKQLILKQ